MPQPQSRDPRVRARPCQEWLELVGKTEEPWRSRFFERLPREVREVIDAASRIAWLPLATHVTLAETMLETFGAVRAHSFYRHAATGWLTNPPLGPVLRTSARILDVTPSTLVRWAPRGWELIFKDCGVLTGESHAVGHARLIYSDLPAICTASEAWMASAQGSAYGVLDVVGFEGVVRLDTSAKSEGRMFLDIEWVVASQR